MLLVRDTYCSTCGTAYVPPLAYPRACRSCKVEVWSNPVPVSVILLPVHHGDRVGVMLIRRAIPPGIGKLALPGGFIEDHESWQAGGAREVREETGVVVDPAGIEALHFCSTEPRPNRVLLFGLAAEMGHAALGAFAPDHETSERGLVFGPDGLDPLFAFPLHAEMVRRFFAKRGITGDNGFTSI